jgi:hypothetical protein
LRSACRFNRIAFCHQLKQLVATVSIIARLLRSPDRAVGFASSDSFPEITASHQDKHDF